MQTVILGKGSSPIERTFSEFTYSCVSSIEETEEGKVESFGVEYVGNSKKSSISDIRIDGISTNKAIVSIFVRRLNASNVDPVHLFDLAEDFVAEMASV